MSNQPKKSKICMICGKPVEKGQPFHEIKTRLGKNYVHTDCFEAEQRELKAEREDANK